MIHQIYTKVKVLIRLMVSINLLLTITQPTHIRFGRKVTIFLFLKLIFMKTKLVNMLSKLNLK